METVYGRKSNFELLRIIAMLMIVALHAVTQSGAMEMQPLLSLNWHISAFVRTGGRVAVTIFIILGAWFLVDSKFKFQRIVRIFLQTVFWGGGITFLCLVAGEAISLKYKIGWMFPVMFRLVWFTSFYIILLSLSPYLNIFYRLKNTAQKILLVILSYITVIMPTLVIGKDAAYYSTLLYMVFVYLLTGYIKKHINSVNWLQSKHKMMLFAVMSYIGLYVFSVSCAYLESVYPAYNNVLHKMIFYYSDHFETVPALFCAYSIFFAFRLIEIPYNRFINYASSLTLGVYIIHQIPSFYPLLWNKIFMMQSYFFSVFWGGYLLGVIFIVYMVGSVCDILWVKIIQRKIFSWNWLIKQINRIDDEMNHLH